MTASASGTRPLHRLNSRPAHSKGRVRSSGNSWVRASISASVSSVTENSEATSHHGDRP
ncbi:hypothetical protein D3C72_1778740 [compost metagenome]